jgi:protocatechuate 3,4-dioxygenase beta subunit
MLGGAAALPGSLAACAMPIAGAAPRTQEAPEAEGEPAPPDGAPDPAAAPVQEVLAATPACVDDDDVTPAQTEGPYFTRNSPERTSLLESGMQGTRLVVAGRILTTECKPVSRALLDFWQADDAGAYDNRGYKLRGHLFTDDEGNFRLQTIVPGLYPGRTRHIHVKVQAPNQPILTTQLYFPNEPRNRQDGIFHPDLVLDMRDDANGKIGLFDFVLRVV